MSKGISPFAVGRDHLHHRLLGIGCGVNQVFLLMLGIHCSMLLLGFVITYYPALELISFWLFVVIVIAHHFLTQEILPVTTANNSFIK